ncbi:MAG TPA: SDR family NAD(P)-dependent oxidoreductase [Bryobacteraceae bacterium]|nr:SDR family NAD(P)-dependent oxidoreductase [Bryobacteraceae bacterium]
MTLKGKKVAVIGATGFIGSHLVDRLAFEGADILAIARSEIRRQNLEDAGGRYEFAACDIVTSPDLNEIFLRARPEIVYLLAARPDSSESAEQIENCIKVNSLGTVRVLEAARIAGVKRLVYGGSSKVFGHHSVPSTTRTAIAPISSYAISKAAAWQSCTLYSLLYPIEVVCLHPAFVYGPRQNWNLVQYVQRCVEMNEPVRLQGGGQTRDPLYVGDVAQAYLDAGTVPGINGSAIPVGGGVEFSVTDLVRRILTRLGAEDTPIEIGGADPRPTEIWRNYTDNADAKKLLGWSPTVNFDAGLRLTIPDEAAKAGKLRHATVGGTA